MIKTTSARMAITLATGQGWQAPDWDEMLKLGCRVDRSGKGTNVPSILHSLDCGRVLAAMEVRGQAVLDWLVLAYSAAGYMDSGAPLRVHERLMDRYGEHDEKESDLGLIAMHNYRGQLIDHGRQGFGPVEICRKMGIDQRRFVDTIKPKMDVMTGIMDRWDRAGLGEVAKALPSRANATSAA